jgi:hypothetical protein
MNKNTMIYIILVSMIFISLGIGVFIINKKEFFTEENTSNTSNTSNATNAPTTTNPSTTTNAPNETPVTATSNVPSTSNMPITTNPTNAPNNNENMANSKQMPDLDTEFHQSEAQIIADNDYKDLKSGDIYVTDQSGNKVLIPRSNVQNSVTYYQPGIYRYGASTYVPNYEDSVFLSKTTGMSSTSFIRPPYNLGGMCNQYKNQPLLLEEACQKLNGNVCASTSCCVLLGGSKCVSGNQRGPKIKSNYSDIFVPNRDYYYYQGKCYGNCPY